MNAQLQPTGSAYFIAKDETKPEKHTLSVLVDNEPGVLARVIGLFSGRGYNIESLTVSETEHETHLSRITIVTSGTPGVLEQIKHQLERIVPVHRVVDLTVRSHELGQERPLERELALVKVAGTGVSRVEALRLADAFRAHVVDANTEHFIFELTGKSTKIELRSATAALRKENWLIQQAAGIDLIPCNDASLYDHVLDTCALVGAVPERYQWRGSSVDLATYFAMARGRFNSGPDGGSSQAGAAMEMTKWFDTNYHYLVPEFTRDQRFSLSSTKPLDEFTEAKALGIKTKVVLLGPVTFLLLGKARGADFNRLDLLKRLLPVYEEVLTRLWAMGAEWVQFDEPILATDLPETAERAFADTYERIRAAAPSIQLMLATYFGDLGSNLSIVANLPVDALHIDLVRAPNQLQAVLASLRSNVRLSLGIVDGRNVWKNDFENSLRVIKTASRKVGSDRLMLAPSCSLLHTPVSLSGEAKLSAELKNWLAFAQEKLTEVVTLRDLALGKGDEVKLTDNRQTALGRRQSSQIHNPAVKERSRAVSEAALHRQSGFEARRTKQAELLQRPGLPTTTIGSFPQTEDVRAARARFKSQEWSASQYDAFLKQKTVECIRLQEEIGLDVLVHGEFERNDMVEYFGEQLEGFAFTQNGWVQSYGSRCVKPPIIFGDVHRPKPMTVEWAQYAQSITRKPMKGMLTGPITILQWSFVRDDQPRSDTARQIALAIRDEVADLESAGIRIIQIDEPALREG
ncbi:MAG: acetolactate synthase small subunit, partial [Kaistia sp. SCN 65-12]